MNFHTIPSKETLDKFFRYDPKTGLFYWKVRTSNRIKVGDRAGKHDEKSGYIMIGFNKKYYFCHRLAWRIMTGEDPGNDHIDHIDVDPSNNRWKNLRRATPSQNSFNEYIRSNNTSGYKGVNWHKGAKAWVACITINYKKHYLGLHPTLESAAETVRAYREKHCKEFTRHK